MQIKLQNYNKRCYNEFKDQHHHNIRLGVNTGLSSLPPTKRPACYGVVQDFSSTAYSFWLTFKCPQKDFKKRNWTNYVKRGRKQTIITNLCWTMCFSTTAQTGSWKDPSIEIHRRSPKSSHFAGLDYKNVV